MIMVLVEIKHVSVDAENKRITVTAKLGALQFRHHLCGFDPIEGSVEEAVRGVDFTTVVSSNVELRQDPYLPELPEITDADLVEWYDGVCPYCSNEHREGEPYTSPHYFEEHVLSCKGGD